MGDRLDVDAETVGRLVADQFPQWAHLPIRPVEPGGWDNRTFRLGDDLAVRMPSAARYVAAVAKERSWLPRLAPHLPLPIPEPVAAGEPGHGYPFPWSVNRWLPGTPLAALDTADLPALAERLAYFLVTLRAVDADDGPAAGAHSFFRGAHPSVYADEVERCRRSLAGRIDDDRVAAIWRDALATRWEGPNVWFHGDVAPGNLLLVEGRLSAIIDFGTSGVGDPACDLVLAWTRLDVPSRRVFRDALGLDDATWARARGWALWKALLQLEGDSTGPIRAEAERSLGAILAERAGSPLAG